MRIGRRWTMLLAFGALVATLTVGDTALAIRSPNIGPWYSVTPGTGERFASVSAYHEDHRRVVVFGGCSAMIRSNLTITLKDSDSNWGTLEGAKWCPRSNTYGDTWIYDGAIDEWTPLTFNGETPSPRWLASMSYDAVSKSVILFGGLLQADDGVVPPTSDAELCTGDGWLGIPGIKTIRDDSRSTYHKYYCFKDTWSLRKNTLGAWTWTRLSPTVRPSARFDAAMASDAAGTPHVIGGCHQMGMVGPHSQNRFDPTYMDCVSYPGFYSQGWAFSDTWRLTWTGSTPTWSRVGCTVANDISRGDPCAPPAVRGAVAATDRQSGGILHYGGYYYTPTNSYGGYTGHTYLLSSDVPLAAATWKRITNQGVQDMFCPRRNPITSHAAMTQLYIDGEWQVHHYGGLGRYYTQGGNQYFPCTPPEDLSTKAHAESWLWDGDLDNEQDCVKVYNSNQDVTDLMCWWDETHVAPGARSHASIAYDWRNGKAVMTGGLRCYGTEPECMTGSTSTWVYEAPIPPSIVLTMA